MGVLSTIKSLTGSSFFSSGPSLSFKLLSVSPGSKTISGVIKGSGLEKVLKDI